MTEPLEEFSLEPAYEWLREKVVNLPSAGHAGTRHVVWADAGHHLGLARDESGRLEVFLVGPPVLATVASVRESMEHDTWSAGPGDSIEASRIRLPAAPHFDQVAAFICAELISAGIEADREAAFGKVEPIIALALKRAQVGNQFLVGLAGELLLLRSLLASSPESSARAIVEGWKGASRSSRDFQLGSVGVEVKSTVRSRSAHHVQGLHQVELGDSVDGRPETRLYMMSVGITWLDMGVTYGDSIGSLTNQVLDGLADPEVRDELEARLRDYGREAGRGSSGPALSESPHYWRRFDTTFARLYDLTDPRLKLPTSADLEPFEHIARDTVAFDVELPAKVNGDLNPVVGLLEAARVVVADAGLAGAAGVFR